MIKIRYMVDDVAKAVEFYSQQLGFSLLQQYGPAVAILERSGVELIVSGPISSITSSYCMDLSFSSVQYFMLTPHNLLLFYICYVYLHQRPNNINMDCLSYLSTFCISRPTWHVL